MKKYLVDIFVPASGKHLDVYLPTGKKIGEAKRILVSIAESLSGGSYKGTAESTLLNAENGEPIDPGTTVYDAGIRNASKLCVVGCFYRSSEGSFFRCAEGRISRHRKAKFFTMWKGEFSASRKALFS
jgi:hypothetical protein